MNSKSTILLFVFFMCIFTVLAQAQKKQWTLEECIEYAKQHNVALKLQQFNLDMAAVNFTQSKGALLPTITGFASHSYNYGQTIDRFTNQFAADMVRSNNFYMSANVTLFNGFQLLNNVRKSNYDLQAAEFDLKSAENDMALSIAAAYLQILYAIEMAETSRMQYEITLNQVERTRKMLHVGSIANAQLLNLEAQAAAEAYQLALRETQLEMAIITLAQLLDIPNPEEFSIVVPQINITDISVPMNAEDIYRYALNHQPSILSAALRVESAKKSYQIAKGAYSPTLTFGASLGTGYSGASRQFSGMQYIGLDTIGITTGTPPDYVLAPMFEYLYEPLSFKDQLNRNFNRVIGFNLSIPIFSAFQISSNVKRSKINIMMAETSLRQSQLNLQKTIYQSQFDAQSALKRYYAALKQEEAAKEVFKLAEERFELNDLTLLEYQDAKTKLVQAQSETLQAKYEYIFKMKILDFYLGKEIKM